MAKKTTSAELRAQAKLLLEKARKIEMESRQELGEFTIKFLKAEITVDELRNKATELGFV